MSGQPGRTPREWKLRESLGKIPRFAHVEQFHWASTVAETRTGDSVVTPFATISRKHMHEVENLTRGIAPSVGPTSLEDALAMYMNRSVEIGWMMVRLLPYLQPYENAFGHEFCRKQVVLADSFRYMECGLSHIGKKIGEAFTAFVDQKFSFGTPFYYREADGSA